MRRLLRSKTTLMLAVLGLGAMLWIGRPPEQGWTRSTSWTPLLEAAYDAQGRRVYPDTLSGLDGQTLRLNGFMVAPENEKTRRFSLSAYPPSCPTCIPAGPEALVDVQTRQPVAYRRGAVSVQGTFRLVRESKAGSFYRMTNAHMLQGAKASESGLPDQSHEHTVSNPGPESQME